MAAQAVAEGSDDAEARRRAIEVAKGAWVNRSVSDLWVERIAPQWPPRRQPGVDRNILRLAVFEMLYEKDIPKLVVVDEAIELAKKYGSEQSSRFVNGLLDGLLKTHSFPGSLK